MLYWIDKESEKNNIIILSKNAIFTSSCDKEDYDRVDEALKNNTNIVELLGKENIKEYPFVQIQNLVSRSTDPSIDIKYKKGKEIEEETIDFEDIEQKQACLSKIEILLSGNLKKSEYQQSALVAVISPLLSLIVAIGTTALYYTILPKTALIIGGIWAAISSYIMYQRFISPPLITRWSVKGKYARKTVNTIKTGFSYLFLAAIVLGAYGKLSSITGPASLYRAMDSADFSATDVETYLDRGANINEEYDGQTALDIAIGSSLDKAALTLLSKDATSANNRNLLFRAVENDLSLNVVKGMVAKGANLNAKDNEGLNALAVAILNDSKSELVEYLLKEGASTDITIMDGLSPIEFAQNQGNDELVEILQKY